LRDIHLPEAIGWWPPAPGWWLLLGCFILLLGAIYAWLRWRTIQKNKPIIFSHADIIQAALMELDVIEQDAGSSEHGRQMVTDLSRLLRRCAVQLNNLDANAKSIAGLTGKAWLVWLDQRWDRHDFTQGSGQLLMHAPYHQGTIPPDDLAALLQVSRCWLEQQQ
jgi:hypothetical protein